MKYDEIKNSKCEVCGEYAQTAIYDRTRNLHYACLVHIEDLWNKIGKP